MHNIFTRETHAEKTGDEMTGEGIGAARYLIMRSRVCVISIAGSSTQPYVFIDFSGPRLFFFLSSLVSIATMHYLAVALPLLTLALAAPSNSVPLKPLNSRQYSEDLAERQSWLLDQAKGLRSKYAPHLGERGQELRRRDIIDEGITRRKRANQKRATGTVS